MQLPLTETNKKIEKFENNDLDKHLNVLIFNSDLPVFPGSGGLEFLNTTYLTKWVNQIGLVSVIHTQEELLKAKALEEKKIKLYCWESPAIKAQSNQALTNKRSTDDRITALSNIEPKPAPLSLKTRVIKWIRPLHSGLAKTMAFAKALPNKPLDVIQSDLYFRHMAAPLSKALADKNWHTLIVIQSSFGAIIDYFPIPPCSILVMHDIRSLVYKRRADSAKFGWQKRYFNFQAKRYFRFEEHYCKKYDLIITLSKVDAEWVQHNYKPKQVSIVPLPVDANYFAPQPEYAEIQNRIVFTGLMSHPPNIDAAIFFAKEVLPLIRKKIPSAEFYIVGKHPAPEVLKLAKLPGVVVTGYVPDTRSYMSTAAIIVVPLRFGSGVRHKILEAWGMQKFIISTTIGAEGLEYQDGVHLKIADDSASMAAEIIDALKNSSVRKSLSSAGREIATTQHHPEQVTYQYYQAIQTATAKKLKQSTPLRIAIDLRWMIPGLAGGIENQARSFIGELSKIDKTNQYKLLLPHQCKNDFDLSQNPNIKIISPHPLATFIKRLQWYIGSRFHSKLRLDYAKSPEVINLRFLNALNVDFAYSIPGCIRHDLYPLKHILNVPDIQHEFFPEFFPQPVLNERRRIYGESIAIAKHICVTAEFSRQTLINKLHVDPHKISVIPLAADSCFIPEFHPKDQIILNKYHLESGKFLFFPAHTWHHKNHITALQALEIIREKHNLKPVLVCTGGAREAQPEIERFITKTNLTNQVRFLGYCPREDVPALYRGALALLYPSLFEGFGLPVLEAMASGCPVICSNTTSLPEIAGNTALLINPLDPDEIAEALVKIIRNKDLREDMKLKGIQQATHFSWQKYTLETLSVFQHISKQQRSMSS